MSELMDIALSAMTRENKLLLVAIPTIGVGLCLGYRVTMGAIGLSFKGLSTISDFGGPIILSKIVSKGMNKTGDNFIASATNSFTRELKVAVSLTAIVAGGIGVATLLAKPEVSSWNRIACFFGLATPPLSNMEKLTNYIELEAPVVKENLSHAAEWALKQAEWASNKLGVTY